MTNVSPGTKPTTSSPLQIFGRADLVRALEAKGVYLLMSDFTLGTTRDAAAIADAITTHSLHSVIAGRHLGKPITFAAAYELVYGERLGTPSTRKAK